MTQYASSDNAFIAYSATGLNGGRGLLGTAYYDPGQKLYIPKITSHSLAFDTTRQEKNYVDGFRKLDDAPELSGAVSGDVTGPLVRGPWANTVIRRVMRSEFGMEQDGNTPESTSMNVGNLQHNPIVIEAAAPMSSGRELTYRYMGCDFTGFAISVSPQQIVTMTATVMGREMNQELTDDGSLSENVTDGKISFGKESSLVYVREGGDQIPAHNYRVQLYVPNTWSLIADFCIASFDLTVSNDAEPTYCIGSKAATGIRQGALSAGIEMSLYTTPKLSKILARYRDDTPIAVKLWYAGSDSGYTFTMPYCRIAAANTPLSGPNANMMTSVSLTPLAKRKRGNTAYRNASRSPIIVSSTFGN